MKTTTLIILILLGISPATFSQPKAYQANLQELAFPGDIAQNLFGTKRAKGTIIQIEQEWEHFRLGKSFLNQPICIGKKKYEHGIGVHARSSLLVQLPKPATRFYAEIGLDNNDLTRKNAQSKIVFSIEAKGEVIWESSPLGLGDHPLTVDIPIEGVTEFYLKVRNSEGSVRYCHSDWANATVVYGKNEKEWMDGFDSKDLFINQLPLSFVMDGQSSRDFLSQWSFSSSDSIISDRIIHKIKWIKPDRTFEVNCLLTEFVNHPAVEWKLYFKNTGSKNSPVIDNISPLDVTVNEVSKFYTDKSATPAIIHCNKGSDNSRYDFMPITETLDLNKEIHINSSPGLGRSSMTCLPFWNFEFHGIGLVTAIGWSGDWKADFSYPSRYKTVMKAGMANLEIYLKPGEEISTPLVCLLYWEGNDSLKGNNLFRRYMREVISPKWNGKEPVTLAMSGGSSALETVSEKNQVDYIQKIAGTGANVYWLDAGWYDGPEDGKWSEGRGNWFPDPKKFPNGMKVLSDEAHKNGLKFLLWFDPECVNPRTKIAREHPEWVIRKNDQESGLFNLGNPEALKYMTDLISKSLNDWGVDVYRNDFNMDPGPRWRLADEPGRTGMTEIRYVEGLYKFWDELRRRKPDLLIDNCASGGRRIDYETCKRSVPLWRSDYNCEVYPDIYDATQNQTFGLGLYLPYSSVGQGMTFNKYKDRSLTTCSTVLSIGAAKADELAEVPFDKVKRVWDDLKSYNYLMKYDFYPLTDFSMKDNALMVFQYDWPEKGEGCVICYRRANSPFPEVELLLKAIDPEAEYRIIDIDSGTEAKVKGKQLEKYSVRMDRLESKVLKYVKM